MTNPIFQDVRGIMFTAPNGGTARLLGEVLADLPLNIKNFGATGDGVTDDTEAIQAALDAAALAGGGVVSAPPGTYLLDTVQTFDSLEHLLVVPSGVSLIGAGDTTEFKVQARNLDTDSFVGTIAVGGTAASRASGVVLRDFKVNGNKGNMTGTPTASTVEGVDVRYADGCTIFNVTVVDCPADGIDLDQSTTTLVLDCRARDNHGTGIHVSEGSEANLIANNVATGNGTVHDRAGIDQFSLAADNAYIGNYCDGNNRNYDFPAGIRVFFAPDNVSINGAEADLLESTCVFTLPSQLAWGRDAAAAGASAAAFGRNASASADRSLAVGRTATASGLDATAVGSSAAASAQDAVAIGRDAAASVQDATAIGRAALADAAGGAVALGRQADAGHDRSVALGSNTTTTAADQIELGPRHLELTEHNGGAPLAPAANGLRLYAIDNGAGQTQLIARFAGGRVPVATEPAVISFTSLDATPSVSGGAIFTTANAGATTITTFDDGVAGQTITVVIGDANTTVDFTGTTLKGNAGVDWSPGNGDFMRCTFDGTNWYCTVTDATA